MKLSLSIIAKLDKVALKSVSEHDFSVAVRVYAEERQWRVHYNRQTGKVGRDGTWRGSSPKGWPDLFCMRRGEIVALELKSETGKASPEQLVWLDELDWNDQATAAVGRPRDAAQIIAWLD